MSKMTGAVRKFFNSTFDVYIYAVLFIVFCVAAYPFWYILVYSLSDPIRLKSGFLLIPSGFTLEAYTATFKSSGVMHAFLVSVARSTIGPALSGFVSMLVAYALSRRGLPGRRFLSLYFIITMYLGAGLIPYYMTMKMLGLPNTFWIYILPGIMNVFGMILMRTYIESLPASLEESACIDGANDLVIYFRIIIPLCIPVIAAVTLFSCVGQWNAFTDTLIYNSSKKNLYTLQYVLVTLVSTVSASQNVNSLKDLINNVGKVKLTPMAVRMAITMVTVIPISMVYPILQRYFIKGILMGAVKG